MASISFTPSPLGGNAGGISPIISPSFAGMGIEPSNLFSFTGFDTANQLSINCFNNLANYTGVPPYIRLGGNTQDYMIWKEPYDEFNLQPNPDAIGDGAYASDSLFFGPRYFEALDRFPTGTPVTFGLNLAYDKDAYGGYLKRIVMEADAARTHMKNVHLQAFEIGNEPDLWLQNGFRTGTWDGPTYAEQWAERAEAIWKEVLQPNGLPSSYFEPGATAATNAAPSFEIDVLQNTPITGKAPGSNDGYVNAWSQHDYFYFIGVTTYALTLDILMDMSNMITQFVAWKEQVQQAAATGKPYVLREMSSVGPVGQVGVSDTFGATLFTFNFFLYTAGLGVSSVEFHMTDTSYAAPWQPVSMDIFTTQPHVRSSYAAWAAMAQIIGPSCTTRVSGLPIQTFPAGYNGRLGAYVTYNAGKLQGLVMINTKQANSTQTSFQSAEFTFNLPDLKGSTFYLSYLTAPGADATMHTTWNGMSYQATGDGTPMIVNEKVDSVKVGDDGKVTIKVRDSQAIVANKDYVLGSAPRVANSNCAALGRALAAVQDGVVQGETQQQSHPISVQTAPNAANPTGFSNYNANGVAQGAAVTGHSGGGNTGENSASTLPAFAAPVLTGIAAFVACLALLL